jgi:hypothetical protein
MSATIDITILTPYTMRKINKAWNKRQNHGSQRKGVKYATV